MVPDRTLTDAWAFDHGDERVSIKHYGPAHTGGDVVIRFERANVAHMGDLMFNRAHPVIDRANGAYIANWIEDAEEGRGRTAGRDDLHLRPRRRRSSRSPAAAPISRATPSTCWRCSSTSRGQVKAGKTREQIVASTDIIKGFEDYGPLIPRPLGPAYDEVTAAG